MATNFEYDHAHYLARRSVHFQGVATASGINGFWVPEFDCTLTAIKTMAVVAGTAAATYIFGYGTATTVIGTLAVGTAAMFTAGTISPNLTLTAGQAVWAAKGNEATGIAAITYEYKVTPLSNCVS